MSLQDKIQEVNSAREQLDERAKTILMDAFKEVFDKVSEIDAVGWLQYTPYFNDGDPCVFRMRSEGVAFRLSNIPKDAEGNEDNWGFSDAGWFSEYDLDDQSFSKESKAVLDELGTAISSNINDLETLGEGRIIVTAAGIDVEEWSHD